MRTMKSKVLGVVLSAAMMVSMGAGIGTNAKAADGEAISTPFTVKLMQNNSQIFTDDGTGMVTQLDALITTTGEYTISAEAEEDVDSLNDETVKYIGITTDLYDSLKGMPTDFEIQGVSITIGDKTYDWNTVAYQDGLKASGEVRLGVVNHYVPTSTNAVPEYTLANPLETNVNGTWSPIDNMEVVAGDVVSFTFKVVKLSTDVSFTSGNFKYKATDKTAEVVGLSAAGKKAKALSVPATVKKDGKTYKVTTIAKNACKGAKATTVTLGKNVTAINASAFANCTNLSKLSCGAKLAKVDKTAFNGCKKTIKVAGSSAKENVKTLKKTAYKKFK